METLGSRSPLQRSGHSHAVKGGRGLGPPKGERPLPLATVAVLAPPPFPCHGSRSRVIRRNSLLGKRGAGVWCVLILGLRSSEGPGELQGGESKAIL